MPVDVSSHCAVTDDEEGFCLFVCLVGFVLSCLWAGKLAWWIRSLGVYTWGLEFNLSHLLQKSRWGCLHTCNPSAGEWAETGICGACWLSALVQVQWENRPKGIKWRVTEQDTHVLLSPCANPGIYTFSTYAHLHICNPPPPTKHKVLCKYINQVI